MDRAAFRVFAPGRVNLIGDHVDYVGGLVLPMAVDLGTTIDVMPAAAGRAGVVGLRSDSESDPAEILLPVRDPGSHPIEWARYPAAVLAEMGTTAGFSGEIVSTLPIGAGLSSSASLEVATALAVGFRGDTLPLAQLCQRAEHRATGVPSGIMDQLAITSGVEGSALLIDCRDHSVEPVPLPRGTVVHAVHCGVSRRLEGSEYADRRRSCELAEQTLGPLRDATNSELGAISNPMIRRRARHVISEISRVSAAVEATRRDDAAEFGNLMNRSHVSLRDDFEVSIPELDQLVDQLQRTPGVFGARLTGAGFGGCVVVLADDSVDPGAIGGWRLKPSAGARVVVAG